MNLSKKIEVGANIAVIVLVALFGWTTLKGNNVLGSSRPARARQASEPKVGLNLTQTPLRDVNWARNKSTLVLGLQTTCHFCTDSSPFFQKLPAAAAGKTKIVAVLPQSIVESREYLSKLGIRVDDIRSAPLASIGVGGTPTMLLVDDKGIVKSVWIGKLPDERQTEVLSAIAAKNDIRTSGS